MQFDESPRAVGVRRLYELMRRVNSSTDLSEVLDEIASGVVEVLGYGIAAIARLEGETFVMTTVAGPVEVQEQIIGRRTPVAFFAANDASALKPGSKPGATVTAACRQPSNISSGSTMASPLST